MSRFTIAAEQWQKVLKDFAEQVEAKKFNKIDYRLWRDMTHNMLDGVIGLYQYGHIITMKYEQFELNTITHKEYEFTLCDNSFGDYLFENWDKIKENQLYDADSLDVITNTAAKTTITGGIDYNNLCASSAKAISGTKVIGYDLDSTSGVSNYGVLDISAKDIRHNGVSIVDTLETKANKSDIVGIVEETIERIFNENKNDDEENKNMKNFNFDFGPVDGSQVRMSIYGMAVKNASGTWVAYDKNTGDIMDVDVFNFDGGKFFYKMPVAVNAVRMGDVVIHARKPMIVKDVSMTGVVVIDVIAGEEKTILPTKSPFGFNFIIRVVSLFDMNGATIADAQNPFGNMLPFFLMGEGKEIDPMMFMLMGNQQFAQNPMMMYFLMKDNGAKDDMLPFLFMMNSAAVPGNATAAPALAQD